MKKSLNDTVSGDVETSVFIISNSRRVYVSLKSSRIASTSGSVSSSSASAGPSSCGPPPSSVGGAAATRRKKLRNSE